MGWNINDINPELRQRIEAQHVDRPAHRSPKPEPQRQDALVAQAGGPRFTQKVRVTVSEWRRGNNWDADNIETKAYIDGLVACSVISGDTIKEAPDIRRLGYECCEGEEERTEILIEEI